MDEYDWSQFHVRMYYLDSLEKVYQRFATAKGLESFFIYRATNQGADGTVRAKDTLVQTGDRYQWVYVHDYAHGGVYEQVALNHQLGFSFGSMSVNIRFKPVGAATEVDLHQTNCATKDPDRVWQHVNCRSCWIYFLTNLRSILAGGPDLRDFQHPNWNDSVSVGFDPSAGPGLARV